MVESLEEKAFGQARVDHVGGWWNGVVVWYRVSMCIWLFFSKVGYFMGIYKVLDIMPEAGAVFGVDAM